MTGVPEEAERFLAAHARAFLLVRRADGWPTGYPMLGLWRDGALHFSTYAKSAKVRNLERDDRVCCLVTSDDEDDPEFRAVLVRGRAEVLPGAELPSGRGADEQAAAGRGVPEGIVERSRERLRAGKRVLVRVVPERVSGPSRAGS